MTFGKVIDGLKSGKIKRAKRLGWNCTQQYIELATHISYKEFDGEIVNADHARAGNCAIAFVGTYGTQVGWLASQADMLSDDWMVIC